MGEIERDLWRFTTCPECPPGGVGGDDVLPPSVAWPVPDTVDEWAGDACGHTFRSLDHPVAVALAERVSRRSDWTPVPCPSCEEVAGIRYVVGYPTEEAHRAQMLGLAILAGCLVGGDEPDFVCRACRYVWRTRPSRPQPPHP